MSTDALPVHKDVPASLRLADRHGQSATTASRGSPTLHDGRSRGFRLRAAAAGIVGLAGLWLAAAFLRDQALHRVPPVFGGSGGIVGVAGSSLHPHSRPSYTALFLLLSYSIVLLGIVFSVSMHDPHATRLRVARKRVKEATEAYDRAFAQRVLDPLKVEQPHLDLVRSASEHVDAVQFGDQRGAGADRTLPPEGEDETS
jgi:hypothetical protein